MTTTPRLQRTDEEIREYIASLEEDNATYDHPSDSDWMAMDIAREVLELRAKNKGE